MQNTDHVDPVTRWFVYHATQQQAIQEFLDTDYEIIPLDFQSEEYKQYSKRRKEEYEKLESIRKEKLKQYKNQRKQ